MIDADLATIALPTRGGNSLVISVATGAHASEIIGETFSPAGTITGQIIDSAEPISIADLSHDPRRAQPQVRVGAIGPALFVPLGPKGAVLGSLAVSRLVGRQPFTETDLDVLRQFAAQASVVIETGKLQQDSHKLSLLEDQERIARDLHDTVIQRLFATALTLQGTTRRIDDDEARKRVESAVDELDATIRHIRTVIFDIEAARESGSLRRQVIDVTRDIGRSLGFRPHTSFTGPVDHAIPSPIANDLLATLREALANVTRHAHASSVVVEIHASSSTIRLSVADDGVGPGTSSRPGGHGVINMRCRAERHGGSCEVSSRQEGGTLIAWTVPAPVIE